MSNVIELKINDPDNDPKFGIGYSFAPTGKDAYSIENPVKPYYTGKPSYCSRMLEGDRTFQAHKNSAFYNLAWFYDGQRIVATWGGWLTLADEWQEGWVQGFDQMFTGDGSARIKVIAKERT